MLNYLALLYNYKRTCLCLWLIKIHLIYSSCRGAGVWSVWSNLLLRGCPGSPQANAHRYLHQRWHLLLCLTCWVNHDYRTCECWSKLACHAGRVKLFLSLCSIIYQHGGGRPSHISPTNICWHPGPLHATSPQSQHYSASITVSQMLFSSAAWERPRSYLPYTHAHRHARYHNAPFIVFTIFKLRKSFSIQQVSAINSWHEDESKYFFS